MATPSFQFVHFLCFCLLEMIFLYDVTFLGLYYRTSWNAKFKFKFPKLVLPLLLGGILWDTSFIGACGGDWSENWTLLDIAALYFSAMWYNISILSFVVWCLSNAQTRLTTFYNFNGIREQTSRKLSWRKRSASNCFFW